MKAPGKKSSLPAGQARDLIAVLAARFAQNPARHPGISWDPVKARLEAHAAKLWSLHEMERTGGEPDVVAHDKKSGEYVFFDCSPQSPAGRASLCYDREALDSRKEFKPKDSALGLAATMGVALLTEDEYRQLQELGEFDTKSSSWVLTPPAFRKLGGALFGDRRYGRIFIYHNGAQSYYSGRGFRASLRV
jgi:hypothetical protein